MAAAMFMRAEADDEIPPEEGHRGLGRRLAVAIRAV